MKILYGLLVAKISYPFLLKQEQEIPLSRAEISADWRRLLILIIVFLIYHPFKTDIYDIN